MGLKDRADWFLSVWSCFMQTPKALQEEEQNGEKARKQDRGVV